MELGGDERWLKLELAGPTALVGSVAGRPRPQVGSAALDSWMSRPARARRPSAGQVSLSGEWRNRISWSALLLVLYARGLADTPFCYPPARSPQAARLKLDRAVGLTQVCQVSVQSSSGGSLLAHYRRTLSLLYNYSYLLQESLAGLLAC